MIKMQKYFGERLETIEVFPENTKDIERYFRAGYVPVEAPAPKRKAKQEKRVDAPDRGKA